MGSSFNLTIPRHERSLVDALSEVPRAFRIQAQTGFKVLASIGKQHYAEILKAVVLVLESRKAPLEDLEKHLGLSQSDLSSLLAASMLTVPILGGGGGTTEEFLAAAVKVDMLPSDLLPNVRPFIETVVAERAQIGRAIRQAALPSQVLPFLSDVEIVVDLRMGFEGDAVLDIVPVAVLHIDTDAEGAEIWFQASKSQLERLKRDIDQAVKRMEAAEAWSQREPTS
jgi:hypothetical protein